MAEDSRRPSGDDRGRRHDGSRSGGRPGADGGSRGGYRRDGDSSSGSGRPRRTRDGARSGFGGRRRDEGGEDRPRRAAGPRRDGAPQGAGRGERERPAHNPRDLRAANRVDQQRSPDIDPDVTGKELDRGTIKEIGGVDDRQAEWVAKHLVMAGRYIDDDPALAFQHALAASRKGGRLSRVREAVALTAYAAGEYGEALREFRTYRRMTGDDTHIAAQVDSERALGRLEKALTLAEEVDVAGLDRAARVELAIVVSGVREDLGDLQGAHDALQIPELDRRRGYPFSPRLFQRQADVLSALGREREAALWHRSVAVAEKALGIGGFAEPEIMDVEVEPAEEDRGGDSHPTEGRVERHGRPRSQEGEQDGRGSIPAAPTAAVDAASGRPVQDVSARETPSTDARRSEDMIEASAPADDPERDPNQMSLFDSMGQTGVADDPVAPEED